MPHSTGFEDECPPLQVVEEVVVVCRAGDDTYEEHVEFPSSRSLRYPNFVHLFAPCYPVSARC